MRDVLEKAKNMSKYKLKAEVAISSEQYNKQILLNKRFFRELGGRQCWILVKVTLFLRLMGVIHCPDYIK